LNIDNDKRHNKLLRRKEINCAPTIREMDRRVNMSTDMLEKVPSVGVVAVLLKG
jgi:ribosomal protein S24E